MKPSLKLVMVSRARIRVRTVTFEEACARHPDRYTMENIPPWAGRPAPRGSLAEAAVVRYFAPQYRSDREWYNNAIFYGEPGHQGTRRTYNPTNHSWPMGQWLTRPYRIRPRLEDEGDIKAQELSDAGEVRHAERRVRPRL